MYSTFYLSESELNEEFLNTIKQLFKNKKLSITIHESVDETDYLLGSASNKKRLLDAIENVNNNKGMIQADLEDLKKQVG